LDIRVDRHGTVLCFFGALASEEVVGGTRFHTCRPADAAVSLRSGTYTVSFTLNGAAIGTASRFISILRAPTNAEIDAMVTLENDAWIEAVDALDVLTALWNSLDEFPPSTVLATIARQQRDIAAAMLRTAEGLQSHAGAVNPEAWAYLTSGIEFWDLKVQVLDKEIEYALATVPWAQVEAANDATEAQWVLHKVDSCALAVLRGYTLWKFADGTPCQ
ncbi:MAG TPA: hypothetical protein QF624_10165, partial [Dehalococcoidia bacterium]|nr:hypothetical protein [Dehalococcoidia bacterium]